MKNKMLRNGPPIPESPPRSGPRRMTIRTMDCRPGLAPAPHPLRSHPPRICDPPPPITSSGMAKNSRIGAKVLWSRRCRTLQTLLAFPLALLGCCGDGDWELNSCNIGGGPFPIQGCWVGPCWQGAQTSSASTLVHCLILHANLYNNSETGTGTSSRSSRSYEPPR